MRKALRLQEIPHKETNRGFGGEIMRRTDLRVDGCDSFEYGVSSVLFIRCMKHREVPQLNTSEINGGECGVCVNEDAAEYLLEERGQEVGNGEAVQGSIQPRDQAPVVEAAKQLIAVIDSEPDGPILKADGQPPWKEVSELIRALVESRSLEHPDEPYGGAGA